MTVTTLPEVVGLLRLAADSKNGDALSADRLAAELQGRDTEELQTLVVRLLALTMRLSAELAADLDLDPAVAFDRWLRVLGRRAAAEGN